MSLIEKLTQELEELTEKENKLQNFIDSKEFSNVQYSEQLLLLQQNLTMLAYINILQARIKLRKDDNHE